VSTEERHRVRHVHWDFIHDINSVENLISSFIFVCFLFSDNCCFSHPLENDIFVSKCYIMFIYIYNCIYIYLSFYI